MDKKAIEAYDKGFADGVDKATIACNSTFSSMLKIQAEELEEELRIGNILTAKLTDKCRELEDEGNRGYAKGCAVTTKMFSEVVAQAKHEVAEEIKRELEEAMEDTEVCEDDGEYKGWSIKDKDWQKEWRKWVK